MKANDYQIKAMTFAKYKFPDYPFSALGEECGEVNGKLAKYARKNQCTVLTAIREAKESHTVIHQDLKKELGDVLWNLSACADAIGVSLNDLMNDNLRKLTGRSERGTIIGSGDNR
jgi:NTP pyrophosphatase (non-canonical NTP hydrolase)